MPTLASWKGSAGPLKSITLACSVITIATLICSSAAVFGVRHCVAPWHSTGKAEANRGAAASSSRGNGMGNSSEVDAPYDRTKREAGSDQQRSYPDMPATLPAARPILSIEAPNHEQSNGTGARQCVVRGSLKAITRKAGAAMRSGR